MGFDDITIPLAQVRVLLRWLLGIAVIVFAFQVALAYTVNSSAIWILAAGTGAMFVSFGISDIWVRRERQGIAVLFLIASFMGVQLFYALLFPPAAPGIAVTTVSIATLALSFANQGTRRVLLIVSLIVGAVCLVAGATSPIALPLEPRASMVLALFVSVVSLVAAIFLLSQFANRLFASLSEIRAGAEDLRLSNDRLQAATLVKANFINAAAHEFRTPLVPIIIQLHLLQARLALDPRPTDERTLGILTRNVNRLGKIVEDVIIAAKLDSAQIPLRIQRISLNSLIGEAVTDFADAANQRGIELSAVVQRDEFVESDPGRIQQVLANLIENGLHFTSRGGRVTVRILRQSAAVVVRVEDTGVGLDADQISKLFRPFSQVHAGAAMSAQGSGIGLFNSKGIVNALGGNIWAESQGPGKGATFTFTLPA